MHLALVDEVPAGHVVAAAVECYDSSILLLYSGGLLVRCVGNDRLCIAAIQCATPHLRLPRLSISIMCVLPRNRIVFSVSTHPRLHMACLPENEREAARVSPLGRKLPGAPRYITAWSLPQGVTAIACACSGGNIDINFINENNTELPVVISCVAMPQRAAAVHDAAGLSSRSPAEAIALCHIPCQVRAGERRAVTATTLSTFATIDSTGRVHVWLVDFVSDGTSATAEMHCEATVPCSIASALHAVAWPVTGTSALLGSSFGHSLPSRGAMTYSDRAMLAVGHIDGSISMWEVSIEYDGVNPRYSPRCSSSLLARVPRPATVIDVEPVLSLSLAARSGPRGTANPRSVAASWSDGTIAVYDVDCGDGEDVGTGLRSVTVSLPRTLKRATSESSSSSRLSIPLASDVLSPLEQEEGAALHRLTRAPHGSTIRTAADDDSRLVRECTPLAVVALSLYHAQVIAVVALPLTAATVDATHCGITAGGDLLWMPSS